MTRDLHRHDPAFRGDPPACSLDATEGERRARRWLHLAEHALLSTTAMPAGVRLRYRAAAEVEAELRALVELERECCAFATWSLARAGGVVVLDVTAEGEGVAAVRAMFGQPVPATGAAARPSAPAPPSRASDGYNPPSPLRP